MEIIFSLLHIDVEMLHRDNFLSWRGEENLGGKKMHQHNTVNTE